MFGKILSQTWASKWVIAYHTVGYMTLPYMHMLCWCLDISNPINKRNSWRCWPVLILIINSCNCWASSNDTNHKGLGKRYSQYQRSCSSLVHNGLLATWWNETNTWSKASQWDPNGHISMHFCINIRIPIIKVNKISKSYL